MTSQYTEAEIKVLAEKMYFELQTELSKRETSNSEAFDKAILTYSTGALALSLGFLKDFAVTSGGNNLGLLYWSWLLFVTCIASTVGSFLVGKFGNRLQLQKAENYYLHRDYCAYEKRNIPSLVTTGMNWLSGLSFCTGALLTVLFVFHSVKDQTMTTRNNPPTDVIQKIASGETSIIKAAEAAHMPRLPTVVTPLSQPAPPPTPASTPSTDTSGNQREPD